MSSNSNADRLEGLKTLTIRVIRERTGLHEQFAVPIANAVVEGFRREFGGEKIYFSLRDDELREKVAAQFNGRNRDEVMAQFRISKSTFYRCLREIQGAQRSARRELAA